jgi:hypothetical protein
MKELLMKGVSRKPVALIFFVLYLTLNIKTVVYAGGVNDRQEETVQFARTLISIEPSVKPAWVNIIPQSDPEIFFVGTSQFYDTPANARDNARESARIQVLEYYGQVIERQAVSLSAIAGSTRDTLAAYVVREDEIRTYAQNVVSEVATIAYYTETYLNSENKEEYVVYTLHSISRQKAEDEIANFAKNISERYTASFSQWRTLKAALEGYAFIARSLEQNPLHRIMAYYQTSSGRAGLYEYVRLQINELANSVSIEAIPARTIQETETFSTPINLRSSILPSTGLLDCQARLFGVSGSDSIIFPFSSASDNPFNLQIRNLQPGSYNVTVEVLLSDLTGGIANNTSGRFTLNVTPLSVLLTTPEALEAGLKRAVDSLAANLPTQTETVIGSFTMTGTDITSELSVYLTEKVTHYAKINQERKYRVTESGTEQAAVISGFFTRRGDRVDVTFELKTPNSDRDGSHIFSISSALLENTIGITIEPANANTMFVVDNLIPPAQAQTIHIEASFNSSDRTYKHNDELILTITADRNCYFKIIHIDVNNQYKMIYPENRNDYNQLSANVSRNVFGNADDRLILCDPYGVESLVIVASPVQFPNIEREYSQPWRAATEGTIRAAIVGAGQALYHFTITPPHEVYEYTRPENMMEFYQALKDDITRQRGFGGLVGDETRGLYSVYEINNIRGSYRVPSDRPDIIQFATYYLDAYTADAYRGTRTRGSSFNFTFARPQNISQAVQTVRSSILEKGGTFTGNEQQGTFSSSGITGQYRVNNVVSVTITEKPFVIPNFLIESEVKNYFGVR